MDVKIDKLYKNISRIKFEDTVKLYKTCKNGTVRKVAEFDPATFFKLFSEINADELCFDVVANSGHIRNALSVSKFMNMFRVCVDGTFYKIRNARDIVEISDSTQ